MALPPDRRRNLQSECRVPFVLAAAHSAAAPRLERARDRFTAASPSSGVGDYFRFRLHRGVSHPPDPNHGRVWVIVPATAPQASPRVSGRCRPALTGVGLVPWDQSRVQAAVSSRPIPTSLVAIAGSGRSQHDRLRQGKRVCAWAFGRGAGRQSSRNAARRVGSVPSQRAGCDCLTVFVSPDRVGMGGKWLHGGFGRVGLSPWLNAGATRVT